MLLSEFLQESHDYLAEHGHCKGDLQTEDGRVCLQGAMAYTLLGHGMARMSTGGCPVAVQEAGQQLYLDANGMIDREIEAATGVRYGLATHAYNDLPSTTKEDVLLMMKRAAHAAEERGI